MRYEQTADVMETGGVLSTRRSSFDTSRKTIRMHIDDIYSDKIGSIVREITANAFDAHLRAGNDQRKFFVHAPTTLKPEFFVRDYGVGMTDQVMEETYIVIGRSDKDTSNAEVGMWGLGSKTPFAYADQYTITCYDGVKARHYGYGIAQDGVPTLYTMSIEDSDEPTGVRIGLSVESKDFRAFEDAIRFNLFAHADGFDTNLPERAAAEIALKGSDWSAWTGLNLSGNTRGTLWWARQGCVLYPIDAAQVPVPHDYRSGYSRTYILECPIGTIRMTPSREAIQYDEEVVTYLKARVEGVKDEIKEAVWEAVKDIESVPKFFAAIERIKPDFVDAKFDHPVTGLKSAVLPAGFPKVFYEAKVDHGQWSFSMADNVPLTAAFDKSLFILDDITPLLDPSRSDVKPTGTGWLTRSEQRRISRFVRAYLDSKELTRALFLSNGDWSDEFLKACFGDKIPTRVTFEDLRNTVPRRVAPPPERSKAPIKGLALAKAAGEQKPVFELPKADPAIAWVTSEQYRRQASALFKLARRVKVDALFIAAPGEPQQMLAEAGYKPLLDSFEAMLVAHKLKPSDWSALRTLFKTGHSRSANFFKWLGMLKKGNPKAYTRLTKGKGELSLIARGVKGLLAMSDFTLTDEEQKAVDTLYADASGRSVPPKTEPALEAAIKAMSEFSGRYANPTDRFIDALPSPKQSDVLDRLVDALLFLQTTVPPSEKF